jgi:hypothetical protein
MLRTLRERNLDGWFNGFIKIKWRLSPVINKRRISPFASEKKKIK